MPGAATRRGSMVPGEFGRIEQDPVKIFQVLYRAGEFYSDKAPNMSYAMYALLVIGGLNTVLSVVYYIKVLKVMILDKPAEELEGRPVQPLIVPSSAGAYACLLAAAVLVLGIAWDPLVKETDKGVGSFQSVQNLSSTAKATVPSGRIH